MTGDLRLFGAPDPFDPTAWWGCSCKVVWVAVAAWEMRTWIMARKAAA